MRADTAQRQTGQHGETETEHVAFAGSWRGGVLCRAQAATALVLFHTAHFK